MNDWSGIALDPRERRHWPSGKCFSGFAPRRKVILPQAHQLNRIFRAAAQSLCVLARLSPPIE
jgi:hypothetical protein